MRAAVQLLDHCESRRKGDTHLHHLLRRPQQRGARRFEAIVSERNQEAELLRLAQQPAVLHLETLDQLLPGEHLRSFGLNRRGRRLAKADKAIGVGAVPPDQPCDRPEIEALSLHLLNQPQSCRVLGPVVAGSRSHLRRGQQAAGLVVADVPHRHPGLVGELLDGHPCLAGRLP
jgi:hypothetical protein